MNHYQTLPSLEDRRSSYRRKSVQILPTLENRRHSVRRKSVHILPSLEKRRSSIRRKSDALRPTLSANLRNRLKQLEGLKYETDLAPLFLGLLNPYEQVIKWKFHSFGAKFQTTNVVCFFFFFFFNKLSLEKTLKCKIERLIVKQRRSR